METGSETFVVICRMFDEAKVKEQSMQTDLQLFIFFLLDIYPIGVYIKKGMVRQEV